MRSAARHLAGFPRLSRLADLPSDVQVTVVRTGGLGDTILTLPTLVILRAAYPAGHLTLVGSTWAEALRSLIPFPTRVLHVDHAFPAAHRDALDGGSGRSPVAVSRAIILYTATPESDFVTHVRHVCPDSVLVWPVTPPNGVHAARHLAQAIVDAPDDLDGLPPPTLECPAESRLKGREWLDRHLGPGVRPLAIHPGSGGAHKCWPAHQFADVAAAIGIPVVLVEGPADADACRRCAAALPAPLPVARAEGTTLTALAGVLTECRGYIGNDSGVSHLAAALGAPTVAVFGPTDPAVWAPLGAHVSVVPPRTDDAWPTVDDVFTAVRRQFGDVPPGSGR